MVEKTFNLLNMITRIYDKIVVVFENFADFLFTDIGSLIVESDIIPLWFVEILENLGLINGEWLYYSFFELVLGTGITLILVIHLYKLIKGILF